MISGIYKIFNISNQTFYKLSDDVARDVVETRKSILGEELNIPELEGAGPFTVEEIYIGDLNTSEALYDILVATKQALSLSLNKPVERIIKLSAAQIKLFTCIPEIQMSEETKKKISKTMKGKSMSDATKQKISVALKKPKRKSTCPHCNLTGGSNAMKRYHFDNCKEKT